MLLKRMRALCAVLASAVGVLGFALAGSALAGQPEDWRLGFQPSVTPLGDEIHSFHDLLLIIITVITLFVMALLAWVMIRYREKRNPVPSKTTHNTVVEVLWTVVPILILALIAIPSFRLLYKVDRAPADQACLDQRKKDRTVKCEPKVDLTIKAKGLQWYWAYEYPDNGNFQFESRLICRTAKECADKAKDFGGKVPLRLLDVDNQVVVPVGATVRVIVIGMDVIHAWTVPAFGAKVDANPGRANEVWFRAMKEGTYYGQCSELCGADHAFMPIAVKVVSADAFKAWLEDANKKFDKVEKPRAEVKPAK